jgi:hypothetical protein
VRQPSISGARARFVAVLVISVAVPHFALGGQSSGGSGANTLSVQDRLDIQELFARYSQALDMGNGDELAKNVFAPNGIFHDPSLCLIGSAELRSGLANHSSRARTSQHWPTNIVITEAAANRAKTHSYVIVFNAKGTMTMGTYHDTLVKSGGRWLIEHRQVWRPGPVKRDPRCPADLDALEP